MANRRVLYSDLMDCGYTAVDMGTNDGVLWATCNIGAHSPEEYGLYFQWGEIQGYRMSEELCTSYDSRSGIAKKYWSLNEYKWCDITNIYNTLMTKYCTILSYGTVDNITTLQLEDDAAYKLMGKGWRMPTQQECANLMNACTYNSYVFDEYNGVRGRYLMSKTTKKLIFIPASGYCNMGSVRNSETECYLWSSSLYANASDSAYVFYINSTSIKPTSHAGRYYGLPIRGVFDYKSL